MISKNKQIILNKYLIFLKYSFNYISKHCCCLSQEEIGTKGYVSFESWGIHYSLKDAIMFEWFWSFL